MFYRIVALTLLSVGCFFPVFAGVTTSPTAPSTDLIASSPTGVTDTALIDETASTNHARGQLFTLPDGGGTGFEITAITIKKSATQAYSNDTLTLRFFEGSEAQWDSGTGHSTAIDADDYYVDTSVTPLYEEAFTLNGSFTNNHYVTFELATPLLVNEDADFGFFMTYDTGGGTEDRFQHRENSSGTGRISITTTSHGVSAMRRVVYFVSGATSPPTPDPALVLGSPFQDGMILQRDKPINIWGEANPSAAVTVSINGTSVIGAADAEGLWKIEMPALAHGGPHQVIVSSGAETNTLDDVLIGDVWITFGQSNMVRPLSEMTGSAAYINDISGNDLPIRCLRVAQRAAVAEEETGEMTWLDNSNPGVWSAVGTVFAHQMYQASGVPTALIWAAWGSSSIEGWMPADMTEQFPHFSDIMDDYFANDEATVIGMLNGSIAYNDVYIRTRPHIIYNQMIHPIRDFGISGFVWYQGEANATDIDDCAQYGFTLPGFVKEYRSRFGQGDLPFLGVQLPSFNRTNWPWFRESQSRLTTVTNAYVAVTLDTGLAGNIHPFDKEQIGVRLARLGRKYVLNDSLEAHGPQFDGFSIAGNQVTVQFAHATGLTTDDALDPATFELAGSDQVFHPATSSSISGTSVVISATAVSVPVAVRYAWSPAPVNEVNLVNSDGLPAAPFRTDTWPLPGLGVQTPQSVGDAYEVARDAVLSIPPEGVLANDIDLNRDPLSATLVSDVSKGTLSLLPDGSFTYTPESGFAGPDSFTYRASDAGLDSPVATVSLTVEGQPSAYYTWKSGVDWGPGSDESETGDPDLDGTVNFLEFAFGLDPLVSELQGQPTLILAPESVLYDFQNAQPGVNYAVELSADLVTWSDPPYLVLTSESITPVNIPLTEAVDGLLYVRLRVSE